MPGIGFSEGLRSLFQGGMGGALGMPPAPPTQGIPLPQPRVPQGPPFGFGGLPGFTGLTPGGGMGAPFVDGGRLPDFGIVDGGQVPNFGSPPPMPPSSAPPTTSPSLGFGSGGSMPFGSNGPPDPPRPLGPPITSPPSMPSASDVGPMPSMGGPGMSPSPPAPMGMPREGIADPFGMQGPSMGSSMFGGPPGPGRSPSPMAPPLATNATMPPHRSMRRPDDVPQVSAPRLPFEDFRAETLKKFRAAGGDGSSITPQNHPGAFLSPSEEARIRDPILSRAPIESGNTLKSQNDLAFAKLAKLEGKGKAPAAPSGPIDRGEGPGYAAAKARSDARMGVTETPLPFSERWAQHQANRKPDLGDPAKREAAAASRKERAAQQEATARPAITAKAKARRGIFEVDPDVGRIVSAMRLGGPEAARALEGVYRLQAQRDLGQQQMMQQGDLARLTSETEKYKADRGVDASRGKGFEPNDVDTMLGHLPQDKKAAGALIIKDPNLPLDDKIKRLNELAGIAPGPKPKKQPAFGIPGLGGDYLLYPDAPPIAGPSDGKAFRKPNPPATPGPSKGALGLPRAFAPWQ